MPKKSDNVRVVVRFRPHNEREKAEEIKKKIAQAPLDIIEEHGKINLASTKHPGIMKPYTFDSVIDSDKDQEHAFKSIAFAPCNNLLDGYNATIFVYGQTGSGKTYTMLGLDGKDAFKDPYSIGLIPRSVMQVFGALNKKLEEGVIGSFDVTVSFLEIYLEKLRDLLDPTSKKKLKVRLGPTGHFIQNLHKRTTESDEEVLQSMTEAIANRTVSATKMNATSSRSHMVMVLQVTQHIEGKKTVGTLNFADLAGSEKLRKTEATGVRRLEAQKINLSLTQLGVVISELSQGKAHVSYRNSELTKVLQDSLGGNCKTTLVVNCSKSLFNREETIGTLEFGKRCKVIKNKARKNEQFSRKELERMLKELRKENETFKRIIENEEFKIAQANTDESALKEKIEQIQKIREQMDEKQSEIDAVKEHNSDLNKQVTAYLFRSKANQKRIQTYKSSLEKTQATMMSLEGEVAEANTISIQKQQENAELKTEVAEKTTDLARINADISSVQERLAIEMERLLASNQKSEALQAHVELLSEKGQQNESEKSAAVQKITNLNKTLESQLKDTRLKAENYQEKTNSLEAKNEELRLQIEKLELKIETLTTNLESQQLATQEMRFKFDNEQTDLKDTIAELENTIDEVTATSCERARTIQEKDKVLARMEREMKMMRLQNMKFNALQENAIRGVKANLDDAGMMIDGQKVNLTQKEKALLMQGQRLQEIEDNLEDKEHEVKQKKEKITSMANSIAYLKNFTKQLEQADRLYAERLQEEMEHEEQLRIRELAEIAKRDREFVERLQEESKKAEETRKTQQKQLLVSKRKKHMRNLSGQSACRASVSGKRKKVAIDVKVGERIKCHDGVKGVVKFMDFVHFTNVPMIGIIVIDGEGDCDGSWDNHTYFQTKPGKGRFCSHPEISHVYRHRASDGKEEKLRYSPNPQSPQVKQFIDDGIPAMDSNYNSPGLSIIRTTEKNEAFTEKALLKMNTDAQIELAMQLSANTGQNFTNSSAWAPDSSAVPVKQTNQVSGHNPASSSPNPPIRSELGWDQPGFNEVQVEKKKMYRRKEENRLFREGSVQILNGLLDSIDDEDQKKQVFDQFVRNRSVALAE